MHDFTPQKRKSTVWYPAVTAWVKIVLDKRSKRNQNLSNVPGVVSKVDRGEGTVNVLFPNKLSQFFYDCGRSDVLLFAIETYPVTKVQIWDGSTKNLDNILRQALLLFTESQGHAVRNTHKMCVTTIVSPEHVVLDGGGAVTSGVEMEVKHIKKGLQEATQDDVGCDKAIESLHISTSPPSSSTPYLSTPPQQLLSVPGEMTPSPLPQKVEDPSKNLREFTVRLSKLFGDRQTISKEEIESHLSEDFSQWSNLLKTLDVQNKIFLAEDAVCQL